MQMCTSFSMSFPEAGYGMGMLWKNARPDEGEKHRAEKICTETIGGEWEADRRPTYMSAIKCAPPIGNNLSFPPNTSVHLVPLSLAIYVHWPSSAPLDLRRE